MKIVLDTNILLVCISRRSKLNWIFQKLLNEEFTICVTTEILLEYAEIIEQHMGNKVSENVLGVLENLPNIEFITVFYKFNVLKDKDDNKFFDCAVAANADFIVTHDSDFNILKSILFPKVNVIEANQFQEILK